MPHLPIHIVLTVCRSLLVAAVRTLLFAAGRVHHPVEVALPSRGHLLSLRLLLQVEQLDVLRAVVLLAARSADDYTILSCGGGGDDGPCTPSALHPVGLVSKEIPLQQQQEEQVDRRHRQQSAGSAMVAARSIQQRQWQRTVVTSRT